MYKHDNENSLKPFFVKCLIIFLTAYLILAGYFHFSKPQKRAYKENAKFAYTEIQKAVTEVYSKKTYLFEIEESAKDELCEILVDKNYKKNGTCSPAKTDKLVRNFTFNDTKIDVFGFDKPPFKVYNDIVKDILVDINGINLPNKIGIDRLPLRIYSTGRLGGNVVPINCSKDDEMFYGYKTSQMCLEEKQLDFVTADFPLSFSVLQIGADSGKSVEVLRNVSYARADCSAFAGESMSSDDYCRTKKIPWFQKCYDQFICSIKLTE